jgi:hypothetical protein
MSTFHGIAAFAKGGVAGVQASQRDWSPFLGHFTSWRALAPLREAFEQATTPARVAEMLAESDAKSFEVVQLISQSSQLAPSRSKSTAAPRRLCFSECTLPGLLGHCERFGRFGFIFRKHALFELGARPCTYISAAEYEDLKRAGADHSHEHPAGLRLALANKLVPSGGRRRIQDFTHEREWRLFAALDLETCPPEMIVAPSAFTRRVRECFPGVDHVLPLDLLYEWGL